MKVVKCANGHFFDGDAYQLCPHCGASVGIASESAQDDGKKEKKKMGLFGHRDKEKKQEKSQSQTISQGSKTSTTSANVVFMPSESNLNSQPVKTAGGSDVKEYRPQSEQNASYSGKKDVTLDFWHNNTAGNNVAPTEQSNSQASADQPDASSLVRNMPVEQPKESQSQSISAPAQAPTSDQQGESLLDKVRNASAMSEGKTMSYFSTVAKEAQTDAKKDAPAVRHDPVVGWLVCIEGEHFGESFTIGAGMNSIGRNDSNRIVLDRDMSVSREKHALITYEPKHRQFYVKPGDSSGLTYVNDEYITESKKLAAKDIIELGSSKFLFVPLCCEEFSWEDYIK